jgi:hypothetical protein
MPIYCDESGGVSAGVMTLAAVHISEANSHSLLGRYKAVTGLHGELKGSRIDFTERGLFYELFDRFDAKAIVATIDMRANGAPSVIPPERDYAVYAALMSKAVGAHLLELEENSSVIMDQGRYDPRTLGLVRDGVHQMLDGRSGSSSENSAHFADSRRCPGVQVADVVANTFYNAMIGGHRGTRMETIVEPFKAMDRVRTIAINAHMLAGQLGL